MSRIGRMPITVPAGVTVKIEGNLVTVSGKLGAMKQEINSKFIQAKLEGAVVHVTRTSEEKNVKAMHGLYRKLIANMVHGVSEGFSKTLIVNGVGYKTSVSGKKLVMNLGMSHTVEVEAPEGITISCTTPTEIVVKGFSKELVGHIAAVIKSKRPIEPYHGYGIRYSTEAVVLKEGKTAGK